MILFGITDISAKMFSVISSVFASGILFLFARKFIDRTTAIFVSILFLLSNAQQYYAIEVRPYAFVQLLCISSFYIYFSLLSNAKIKHLILLFIINLLLLFTHYLTIFIFIVQFIGILFYLKKNRKAVLCYFISQVLVLISIIPWLRIAFSNIPKSGAFWNHSPDYFGFRWATNILLGNEMLYYIFNGLVIFSLILYLLNKKLKIFKHDFNSKYYFLFLFLYFIPIILDFVISQYTPVFVERYFLYSLFGLFLFIAYSFSQLNIKPIYKSIAFCPLLLLIMMSFNITQERQDDWKHVVPEIKKIKEKNSLIYISASYKYKDFCFYYDLDAFKDYNHTIDRLEKQNVIFTKFGEFDKWKKIHFDNITKVIYLQAHSQFEDSLNEIKPFIISKGFIECDFFQKGGIQYTVFARDTMECYPYKIISPNKNNNCDWMERYSAVTPINDSIELYKTSFEPFETCVPLKGITELIKHTGKYSFKINEQNQFSLGINKPLKGLFKNKRTIHAAAYINMEEGNKGCLVFTVEKEGKILFWKGAFCNENIHSVNVWQKMVVGFTLPDTLSADSEVKIYFWNPSKSSIYVDDYMIQTY